MRHLLSRLLSVIPVLLVVSVIVFFVMHLIPGDPVTLMTGELYLTAEHRAELMHQLGLDKPLLVQLGDFLWRALHGDLGHSIRYKLPVTQVIASQTGATLELTLAAFFLATVIGVVAGLAASYYHHTLVDNIVMVCAILGLCIPSFWLGLLLMFLFSLRLGWLPTGGTGGLDKLILPAFTLGLIYAATTARMMRSTMLETLNQDYIRTARAKGLSERVVFIEHAMKNALIPVVTVSGLQLGQLFAGAVVVETVFARQGLGSILVHAILNKDYPMVQGLVVIICAAFVLINVLVDLLYMLIDPRIREI